MILAAKIQVKELESKRGTTSLRRDHFFRKQLVIGNCNFLDTTWHRTNLRPTRRQVPVWSIPWTYSSHQNYPYINMIVPLQSVPIPVKSGVQWTGRWIFVSYDIQPTATLDARYIFKREWWSNQSQSTMTCFLRYKKETVLTYAAINMIFGFLTLQT